MSDKTMPRLTDNERQAIDEFIRRLYAKHGEYVVAVVLFGSKARGDSSPDSDIDILVRLTKEEHESRLDIWGLGADVSLEYDLLLSIRVIGPEHWRKLAEHRFTFYKNIQTDGIDLTPVLD